MADESKVPFLNEAIPRQVVHEGAALGPLYLGDFIHSPQDEMLGDAPPIRFTAELSDGRALPSGCICTSEGLLTGLPANGTHGQYTILVTADNGAGSFQTEFELTILERNLMEEGSSYFTHLKSRVWEALGNNLPLPEIQELFDRPLTVIEVYYLLQRFATLTIWDVYNLDPPSDKKLLTLPGVSEHYNVYDRGSCLVGAPKDLFSHERNLQDALQTAKAMAAEVFKRGWTIEFAGFDKMSRAGWVELQVLADRHGKSIEILHYQPSTNDFKLYEKEVAAAGITPQKGA